MPFQAEHHVKFGSAVYRDSVKAGYDRQPHRHIWWCRKEEHYMYRLDRAGTYIACNSCSAFLPTTCSTKDAESLIEFQVPQALPENRLHPVTVTS